MSIFRRDYFIDSLVSEPIIWGKLPSQGDYVRYRLKAEHIESVQAWVSQRMRGLELENKRSLNKAALLKNPSEDWRHLSTPTDQGSSFLTGQLGVPWSFILPPNTLSFAPKDYVIGVWMESSDKIGRVYPLLMLQIASPKWLHQTFASHGEQPKDWLFFAARVIAQTIYTEAYNEEQAQNQMDILTSKLDQLWALYKPHWTVAFGGRIKIENTLPTLAENIVGQPHEDDVAQFSDGVRFPPWGDWPERVLGNMPKVAFWQQNVEGRFVGAREV